VMSVLPMAVLYYLYVQMRDYGRVDMTSDELNVTLYLIVIGIAVGYLGMRSVLRRLMIISRTSAEALKKVLGPHEAPDLDGDENEITVLTRSFEIAMTRLRDNIRNLELAKKTLHSVLAKVGSGIASMENIDSFLELILETVAESLGSATGALLLVDPHTDELCVKTVYGARLDLSHEYRMQWAEGPFEAVRQARDPVLVEQLGAGAVPDDIRRVLFTEPLLCAPLILRDAVFGAIAISRKKSQKPFTHDEFNLLKNIAQQTAVAVENSQLNEDAERTYFETISALALAVEAKDVYSRGHLDRVAEYATKIAQKLHLSNEQLSVLRDAARLHDVGKIGVYDDVLRKPGKLTAQEREMIVKHPAIGESIIKPIRSLRPLCDVVRHHHERLDGSGYPDGLKGDQISLLARILAVADIYDALTTDRPYRKGSSPQEAKNILRGMQGEIDMDIVNILCEVT